jgi:outer membrane protein OmpA-like peptidoglycan-associated protein
MPISRRHVAPLLLVPLMAGLGACASAPPAQQAFVVFFDEWSASPPAEANAVLDRAAGAARADANAKVTLIGFADPDGSPEANRTLSRQRADNVADALSTRGIDPRRFVRIARGATEPTLAMVESRRVEIRIGQ